MAMWISSLETLDSTIPYAVFMGRFEASEFPVAKNTLPTFSPDEDLMANESTEFLYTSESIGGDAAKDLSSKGNDGKLERKRT